MASEKHATVALYWKFAGILCLITFVEWFLFKHDATRSNAKIMIPVLLTLSFVKFTMVCGWYMHLRYDPGILTKVFLVSLGLAAMVYTIVLFCI